VATYDIVPSLVVDLSMSVLFIAQLGLIFIFGKQTPDDERKENRTTYRYRFLGPTCARDKHMLLR